MSEADGSKKDPYEIMGVKRDSTTAEIKKAYRKLAATSHPDRFQGHDRPLYEERFKDINWAYEILKDPEKRQRFDRTGSTDADSSKFTYESAQQIYETFLQELAQEVADYKEFEKSMQELKIRGRTKRYKYEVTLEQIWEGGTKTLEIKRLRWNSKKQIYDEERVTLDFKIPAGVKESSAFRFSQAGNDGPGMEPGDIIIQLVQLKHHLFQRRNADILYKLPISLKLALFGKPAWPTITLLNGDQFTCDPKKPIQPGERVKFPGMGFLRRNSKGYGSLIVQYEVFLPNLESLSLDETTIIQELLPD